MGTYQFFPPECCNPDIEGFSGKSADIWALGLTLYAIIYKKLPFTADSLIGIFDAIQAFELIFDECVPISPALKHLVTRLLDKNPDTRIKMYELIQDPWINMDCNPLIPTTEGVNVPTDEEIQKAVKPIRNMVIAVRII